MIFDLTTELKNELTKAKQEMDVLAKEKTDASRICSVLQQEIDVFSSSAL